MANVIWFRESRIGNVPVHWTPVSWQGWAITGLLTLGIIVEAETNRTPSVVWIVSAMVAATIVVCYKTSDHHSE